MKKIKCVSVILLYFKIKNNFISINYRYNDFILNLKIKC